MADQPVPTAGSRGPAALDTISQKTARGALVLGGRQALVHALNLAGGILLARWLTPAEFGIYAILMFVLNFLGSVGDVGLGASLIREPEEPTVADYRAIFTAQQILVFTVVVAFWTATPWIVEAYGRPAREVWLFRLLALSLVFTSLQTIAAIQLERQLEFRKLALVEVAQALTFNALAVGLAWAGAGAQSIAIALPARAAVGAALVHLVRPWPIGLRWDWARIRDRLRYGLPYQGIGFVSLVKDSITPVFVGILLGTTEVGYINWATMVAAYPVLALMALQRLYLPAFSRLQSHPAELGRLVERVIRATNSVVAPVAVLMLALIDPVTRIIFGEQWLPALPCFYFLWAANVFVPTATPLLALMNALGDSRLAFRFALVWFAGTWLLGVPLILAFGAVGFAIANFAVQWTNLALYRAARARVPFRILAPARAAWTSAAAAGLGIALLARRLPITGPLALAVCGLGGLTLYAAGLFALDREGTRRAIVWIRSSVWTLESRS
ncbi:MAG TPA: oligosaccharide flippase family protein [Longimicrobiales bacterium]